MDMLFLLLTLVSSIWVFTDAQKIGVKKGLVTGLADLSPAGWLFACLLLWIVALPLYLIKRPALKPALLFTHKSRHRTLAHEPDQDAVRSQWWFHWQVPQRRYGPCARVPCGRVARRPSVCVAPFCKGTTLAASARLAYDHRAARCGATCVQRAGLTAGGGA